MLVSSVKYKLSSYDINGIFFEFLVYINFPPSLGKLSFFLAIISSRRMEKIEAVIFSPSYSKLFGMKLYFGFILSFIPKITSELLLN